MYSSPTSSTVKPSTHYKASPPSSNVRKAENNLSDSSIKSASGPDDKNYCIAFLNTIWNYVMDLFEGIYNAFKFCLTCGCRDELKTPFGDEKWAQPSFEETQTIRTLLLSQPSYNQLSHQEQKIIYDLALYAHSALMRVDQYHKDYPDFPKVAFVELQLGDHKLPSQLYFPTSDQQHAKEQLKHILASFIDTYGDILHKLAPDDALQIEKVAYCVCQTENRVCSFYHHRSSCAIPRATSSIVFTKSGAKVQFTNQINKLMGTSFTPENLFNDKGKLLLAPASLAKADAADSPRAELEKTLDIAMATFDKNGNNQKVLLTFHMEGNPFNVPLHYIRGKDRHQEKLAILRGFDQFLGQIQVPLQGFSMKAAIITEPEKKKFALKTITYDFRPLQDQGFKQTQKETGPNKPVKIKDLISELQEFLGPNIIAGMIVDKDGRLLLQ